MTRVALVEDDREVREGLQVLLGSAARCSCVAAFGSAEEALAAAASIEVDVVLMDIQLPGMTGIECIRRWKQARPAVQIMMLTVFEDHDRIFRSLAAGATGYILKQTPPEKLLEAITELHHGGSPMSSQIARQVVRFFQNSNPEADAAAAVLSPREREIVELLARGHLYKEIAEELGISVETIRTHIHHIYQKLHVGNRTEAVMKLFGNNACLKPRPGRRADRG